MRKNSINNVLLVIGLIFIVIVTPASVLLFTTMLAEALCVPQNLKGTEICLPNGIPAFAITLLIPFLLGTTLVVLSVLKRK